MRAVRVVLSAAFALAGCTRPASGDPARPAAVAAVIAPALVPVKAPGSELLLRPWVELVRREDWSAAFAELERESAPLRDDPWVRYAAAVAAENAGEYARGLTLLASLERTLPAMAERVSARRGRVAFQAGELRVALEALSPRSDTTSRLRVAQAHARLGEHVAAQAVVDALLKKLPRRASLCGLEAPLHRVLADIAQSEPPAARDKEIRWLLTQAPLCASSEGLESKAPALTTSERLTRARAFAEGGRVEDAERELGLVVAPPLLEAGQSEYVRAFARYQARRDLTRAAELFVEAAQKNPTRAPEWLFLAGRAHERGGAFPAAEAAFERVRSAHPKSGFADPASYRLAQLAYAGGRFDAASTAYQRYLTRFGARARYATDAREERAVSWLAAGRANDAAREMEGFAKEARDGRERVRYLELQGLAELRRGKTERARTLFREVVQKEPLSFMGLCASARLATLGEVPAAAIVAPPAALGEPRFEPVFPEPVASLWRVGLDREAESMLAELEGSIAKTHAGRSNEALCSLYGRLAPAERTYRTGQRVASAEELAAVPAKGRRWLWDCVYPRPYSALVSALAAEHGIEPELLYAVMRQESAFRPDAVSPARASGLLQLMPATAERLSSELGLVFEPSRLHEPALNLRLGARYLRKLLDWFDGNVPLAVASYNAGPVAVRRWLESSAALELDLFVARIPYEETRNYVERVVSNYARYRYLRGGPAELPKLALALPKTQLDGGDLF